MKSQHPAPPSPNLDRNQKIASILTLLITISAKIERLKQKICGFSPNEFSPECVFQALDLTSKGYLDLYDIRCFIGNDSIKDRDILLLFMRFGATQNQPKLTYLGYLNFLKPYFNAELARDLLRRDTVSRRVGSEERVIQTQETILLLINELLLLNCVCVAEHQELKEAMMEEYMLNVLQMGEILGLGRGSPLRAIFQFIDCNSDFDVEEGQLKFLLSYLQVHQFDLPQEHVLGMLFMPTNLTSNQNATKQGTSRSEQLAREREKLHTNYNKSYLGRKDLFSNTHKISFLQYIHPNSYQPQPEQAQPQSKRQKVVTYASQGSESNVAQEHGRLGVPSDRRIKQSYQQMKKVNPPIIPQVKLDYSIVEPSNVFGSKRTDRLDAGNQDPLYTPILQQFMHESNLKHNMGAYHQNMQNSEHRTFFEESSMSYSEAFDRAETSSRRNNPYPKKQPSRYVPMPTIVQNRPIIDSSAKLQNSSGLGILGQFMRN